MQITVNSIESVSVSYKSGPMPALKIFIFMNESQTKEFLTEIWENYGDKFFEEYFYAEGYIFAKKIPANQSSNQADAG